jgi:hypothetical protein
LGAAAALLIVLSQLPRIGGETRQRSAAARRVKRHGVSSVHGDEGLRLRGPN